MALRVLLVEDEPGDADLVAAMLRELRDNPFTLTRAESVAAAIPALGENTDVILLDLGLPDSFGLATLLKIQKAAGSVPIVVLTGHDDEKIALEAMKHGAQDYLIKGQGDGVMLARVLRYAIERHQGAVSLEKSERRFRDYAAASSDWFWETDRDFNITFLSERFTRLTGHPSAPLIGRPWTTPFEGGDAAREAFRDRQPFRDIIVTLRPADGANGRNAADPLVLRIGGVPVADPRDGFIGYRGTATDVSEQHRMRLALEEAKSRAEEGARAKSAFLAIMGHEVRTPLQAILGLSELLLGEQLSPGQRARIQSIVEAGEQLLSVLNDILDFSRLEAGRLPLQRVPFALAPMTRAVTALMDPLATGKGLSLRLDLAPEAEGRFWGDPVRLRQVLVNLVGNAVKFTDTGSVTLRIEPLSMPAGKTGLRFSVVDTGIGIPPEALPSLFTEFRQVDPPERARSGSGLGLAICKRLVDLMEGRIGVTSTPGLGSTFWFEVALDRAPAETLPATPLPPDGGLRRVLLVEDHEVNRQVAAQILSRAGWRVIAVDSGERALDALVAAEFDVILLDMKMPGMDGRETVRRIRALNGPAARIPILAFSAHRPQDWKEAGFDGFVGKPLRLAEMDRALTLGAPAVNRAPESSLGKSFDLVDEKSLREDEAVLGRHEVERLFALFRETAGGDLRTLAPAAAPGGDCRRAAALAHRLASASASVHMPRLADCFHRIEVAAESEDRIGVRHGYAEAEVLWQASLASLRGLLSTGEI
jgi:PAS domain S-box-containing protein